MVRERPTFLRRLSSLSTAALAAATASCAPSTATAPPFAPSTPSPSPSPPPAASTPSPPACYADGTRYTTAAHFRRTHAALRPSSARRRLQLSTGAALRLAATPAGGDCGFQAVAWALICAGVGGPSMSGSRVRALLASHVAAQRPLYERFVREWGVGGDGAVEAFLGSVRREGLHGHWLGQSWGFLELVALARALCVCVELYTFDVKLQRVRLYHCQNEGKRKVALFFSGEATAGHFDVLLPVRRTWWRRE